MLTIKLQAFILLNFCISFVLSFPNFTHKKKENKVLRVKLPVYKKDILKYNPKIVDWAGVISGCKASCRYEKRLCNFYIRAAAHDSLSVSEGYGGPDGSLLLTQDELRRSENNYDNFAFILSKNALSLAKKYNSSVADIISVCGAVSTEFLGGPKIVKYDEYLPFLVGRIDSDSPNPANQLAPANMNTTGFASFAQKHKLTIEEMTALMGSHSILDEKRCLMSDQKTKCDPLVKNCTNLSMFNWSNLYYKETCSQKINIHIPGVQSTIIQTKKSVFKEELCKFTSEKFKQRNIDLFANDLALNAADIFGQRADVEALDLFINTDPIDVTVNNTTQKWMYTVHDAWMGKACQNELPMNNNNLQIKHAMNKFKIQSDWDKVYIRAYKKMVNNKANWATPDGYPITGHECRSGYKSSLNVSCTNCDIHYFNHYKYNCHSSCKCTTSFSETDIFYE